MFHAKATASSQLKRPSRLRIKQLTTVEKDENKRPESQKVRRMATLSKAEIVAAYIRARPAFAIVESMERYHHMGATLADAVLQRGIEYKAVVAPRIKTIVGAYPEAITTSAFSRVVSEHGAAQVLDWSEGQKPQTLVALIRLLLECRVETEDDLRACLERPGKFRTSTADKGNQG